MTDQEKPGLKAVLEEAGVDEALAARLEHQMTLWPTPARIEEALADDATAERRGPGRPPGSRNKRTDEWAEWILGRHTSPLDFLATVYTRPVEMLALELGCKRLEALKLQVVAAKELAPYVHQKQPVSVNVDQTGVVTLILEPVAPAATGIQGEDALVIEGQVVDQEDKENQ